jgi:hypothetical protein
MAKTTRTFSFDPQADRELLDWLDGQKNRSAVARRALRAFKNRASHAEYTKLEAKLDRVLERLSDVELIKAAEASAQDTEPAEARRGLDVMKARFGAN